MPARLAAHNTQSGAPFRMHAVLCHITKSVPLDAATLHTCSRAWVDRENMPSQQTRCCCHRLLARHELVHAAAGAQPWAAARRLAALVNGCVQLQRPTMHQQLNQQIVQALTLVLRKLGLNTPRLAHVRLQNKPQQQQQTTADDSS